MDLDLLTLSVEEVGLLFFLLRAAARTAAVVEPEELAKSVKPRNPMGLLMLSLLVD